MENKRFDVAIIGGGIIGLASAMALVRSSRAKILLLEAESRLASHQTGHNSGVIHSGLYYKPGSSKARNCSLGREAMYRFCAEHGIAHEGCGKIVVATRADEVPRLEQLHQRGIANGLLGLRRISAEEIAEFEPHAAGVAGLLVPQTGIVDYVAVAERFAELAKLAGASILIDHRLQDVESRDDELHLQTSGGGFVARHLINCGGLQCDRVARMCGLRPRLRIVPFRGEYYELIPESAHLVRNLIYPVPDPQFPFLGVHFTRMIHGGIEAGPNAVLSLNRHGYSKFTMSPSDAFETLSYAGFWRLSLKHWRTGLGEQFRSYSKRAFVHALQELVPDLKPQDVRRAGAGVRAQAVAPDGSLIDDFHIEHDERCIHVLNAPSPAATASISIGQTVAKMAVERFGLG